MLYNKVIKINLFPNSVSTDYLGLYQPQNPINSLQFNQLCNRLNQRHSDFYVDQQNTVLDNIPPYDR